MAPMENLVCPRVLRCLEDICECLQSQTRKIFFPHLLTAFFQTVWDVSAADKNVIVPTRSRYSRDPPKLSPNKVLNNLHYRLERILTAQKALAKLGFPMQKPSVRQANSLTEAGWDDERKDVILTSPAYGCGINYERIFRLQMRIWESCVGESSVNPRSHLVGRASNLHAGPDVLPESEQQSDWYKSAAESSPQRLRMFVQYADDLRTLLHLCSQHLSKRGVLGLVMGNPQIAKRKIPLTRIVRKIAEEEGFVLQGRPHCDPIRTRSQNLTLKDATGPIKEEYLLNFRLS